MIDLARPLAVVAHDAGSANIILAWLEHEEPGEIRAAMSGPAEQLWRARFGGRPLCSVDEALAASNCLLSGTGWSSNFEHDARVKAATAGLPSVAVIDHWTNYAMRFERHGLCQLPDLIWVTDEHARRIALQTFPDVGIEVQPNLYLEEQARLAGRSPRDGDILFVLEPVRDKWGDGRPGEFQALDYFISQRLEANIPKHVHMRLRPHPSDPPGKYDDWLASNPHAALDASPDLAAAMVPARWVVGMNSMALVVALQAGRTTLTIRPQGAPPCVLPQGGLIHL